MKKVCRPDLPEEMVVDILLRLPPESLVRFKRVCKSWYALIKDPSFVNKHLHFTITKAKKTSSSVTLLLKWASQELSWQDLFYGRSHDKDLSKQVLSLVTIRNKGDSKFGHERAVEKFKLPPVPKIEEEDFPGFITSSHCNGIVCLFDACTDPKETIVLCNPILGEIRLLRTQCPLPDFKLSTCGFGYDSRTNDYKCIKLYQYIEEFKICRAQVYTLGTDSWRDIEFNLKSQLCEVHCKGVYSKDVYYWLGCGMVPNWPQDAIISFNMCEEEFRSIPLPDHVQRTRRWYSLALWKSESVVLFGSTELNTLFPASFEMWVMVIEGDFTHWTKHLTIGPLGCIKGLLDFWKYDELLIETTDGLVASYNLYNRSLRKLPIHEAVLPWATHAELYTKSLVSVKGGRCFT